ncbi:MAG: HD domain-containing protein [Phycisphaerae bacterium]|nr:HD domain-containing protein [Phycisphaerae bacterium]
MDEATRTMLAAAEGLLAGFETIDLEMACHCRRVSALASRLAAAAGLPGQACVEIEIAGLLHDVGKFTVPPRILGKPGPLSPGERSLIEEHSRTGAEIVGRIAPLQWLAPWVAHHHERWDGTGYPAELSADEIPLASRAIAIVDAFDAMTEPRSYAPIRTREQAAEEILRSAGTQFDPVLASIFVHAVLEEDEGSDRALAAAA